MNDVVTLYEKCEHGYVEPHWSYTRTITQVDSYLILTSDWIPGQRCPGGKEIVMRREWRCVQGKAYGGPCTPEEWADMDPDPVWVRYPSRHQECGWVWVEVSDE